MRVFITGATGFIGAHLAEALVRDRHDVALLLRSTSQSWRLDSVREKVTIIHGELGGEGDWREAVAAFAPDAIAHMAWRGVGGADRNSPIQAENVLDAVDLVQLAVHVGAKAFVGAGSQAEYGPYQRVISESDQTNPTTLYGMAKRAAGEMCGLLAAEKGLRFTWLRIFSTYGPKDADYWLIPSFIRTLRSGQRMALTKAEQRWGFLHVRDAADAFKLAVTSDKAHGLYNVGSPDAPLLRDTMQTLRSLVNPAAELGFGDVPYRPDQVMVLQADVARLTRLGWAPKVTLEDGLAETVRWYDRA